jgi:hypothetical protein
VVVVVPLVLMLLGDRRGRADRQRHGSADHGQDESHRVPQLAFCLPTGLADGLAGPGIDRSSRYKGGKAPDSPQYRGLVVAAAIWFPRSPSRCGEGIRQMGSFLCVLNTLWRCG